MSDPERVKSDYPTNDDDQPICGRPTGDDQDGDPCRRPVSEPGAACYLHPGDGDVPDTHGAPEGNQNAVGNKGGPGAPEGNFRALKTGAYVAAKRRLQFILEERGEMEAQVFANYFIQEVESGATPNAAMKIATALAFSDELEEDLISNGFDRPLYQDGKHVADVLEDRKFDAMSSMWREARLLRREEGVTANSNGGGSSSVHGNKDRLIDQGAWSTSDQGDA